MNGMLPPAADVRERRRRPSNGMGRETLQARAGPLSPEPFVGRSSNIRRSRGSLGARAASAPFSPCSNLTYRWTLETAAKLLFKLKREKQPLENESHRERPSSSVRDNAAFKPDDRNSTKYRVYKREYQQRERNTFFIAHGCARKETGNEREGTRRLIRRVKGNDSTTRRY